MYFHLSFLKLCMLLKITPYVYNFTERLQPKLMNTTHSWVFLITQVRRLYIFNQLLLAISGIYHYGIHLLYIWSKIKQIIWLELPSTSQLLSSQIDCNRYAFDTQNLNTPSLILPPPTSVTALVSNSCSWYITPLVWVHGRSIEIRWHKAVNTGHSSSKAFLN